MYSTYFLRTFSKQRYFCTEKVRRRYGEEAFRIQRGQGLNKPIILPIVLANSIFILHFCLRKAMKQTIRTILPLFFLLVLCSCKDKPKEATESSNNCLTAITIASILILIHSNAYIDNLSKKRNQNRIFAQQLETIKENICQENDRIIKESQKRIEELERKIEDTSHANTLLQAQLQKQKHIILCTNKPATTALNEQEQAETNFRNSEIYLRFKRNIDTPKSSSDWQALQDAVDKTYNNFTESLYRFYSFSNHELQVCLLIKINMQPSDIAKLTNHTKEAITATRRRLYEKVFQEKGTPKLWDEFIHAL